MALKLKYRQLEVKHEIIAGTLEQLNNRCKEMLKAGYELLDVKVIMADVYNQVFTVLYIWVWQIDNEK